MCSFPAGCIKDEDERFCQDFLRDNNAFDNVTNACVRDRACVGACGGAILDVSLKIKVSLFDRA